jgi:hypothetical protein
MFKSVSEAQIFRLQNDSTFYHHQAFRSLLRDESETAVSSEAFVSASTLNLMLEIAPAPPELGKLPSGIAEPGPRSLDAPS